MNPVTFNEPFAEMLDDLIRMRGFYAESWTWQTAPLFVYSFTEERESELAQWRMENPDYRMHLPYETVRLALTQHSRPERGKYVCEYVAASPFPDQELLYVILRIRRLFDETSVTRGRVTEFVLTDFEWQSHEPVPDSKQGYLVTYNAMGRFDGKWIPDPIGQELSQMLHMMITGSMNCFVSFAMDAMMPNTHTALVRPDQPHRSVEWLRQREHYTLISHGHPANTRDLAHGASIRVDERDEIQRMAHARRAHFRTLRSERYRFARGSQVFVRSSWVGPKEWKDSGSHQVYRILEPARDQPANARGSR